MQGQKKGEGEGKEIATIVLVLALMMALYILLIPPAEREELLEGDIKESSTSSEKIELLAEAPGELSPREEHGTVHALNNINLFIKNEPELIALADAMQIKKSLFGKSSPTFSFDVKDTQNLIKANLFFSVTQPKGTLKVQINNQQVFSKKIEASGVKIIEIPLNYIKEKNKIGIAVASPGLAFWRTNVYNLEDIGIKLEYELINAKESRSFTMPAKELEEATEAKFKYYVVCNAPLPQEFASLRLILNDNELFEGQIRCISAQEEIDIPLHMLQSQENELMAIIDEGQFALNQMKIETKSEGVTYPTYFFTITSSNWEKIESGTKDALLKVFMEETTETKNARFVINDETVLMKTTESTFETDITDFLEEGTNFIRITPTTTFTMTGLKVILQD